MLNKIWRYINRRYLHYIAVYSAKMLLRLILLTCRIEVRGLDQFFRIATQKRCILMLWHNRLAILPEILEQYASQFVYCAFVSKSRDGDLMSILANSYPAGRTLRVPHNARRKALNQMIDQLKEGGEIMVLTPDGPRGPRYEVKPGIAVAAKEAAAYIVPFSWSASRLWQLKTWDKLMFPMPFSKISASFGDSIFLDIASEKTLGEETGSLKQALQHLDAEVCGAVSADFTRWPK